MNQQNENSTATPSMTAGIFDDSLDGFFVSAVIDNATSFKVDHSNLVLDQIPGPPHFDIHIPLISDTNQNNDRLHLLVYVPKNKVYLSNSPIDIWLKLYDPGGNLCSDPKVQPADADDIIKPL